MIKWGIIGCGAVTEVKSGPALQKASNSQLAAVMRRDARLAEDYARRHSVPRWYDNAEALISDAEVDIVYIATPPGTHAEYAQKALAAGKPVYVEKPMARNATECREMIEAASQSGKSLFVAYYRRALPRFVKARELIAEGAIGVVTGVHYQYSTNALRTLDSASLPWRFQAEHSGGGLFLDMGSHTLDILDYLLGPLEKVEGSAANLALPCGVEDTVAMSFVAAGAPGVAHWNTACHSSKDEIEIAGTKGTLTLSCFGNEPVRLVTDGACHEFDLPNPEHVQQPLIQTIVDELTGKGACPSTAQSAMRTSLVMDKVLASYYGGRDDKFWERPETWPGRRG